MSDYLKKNSDGSITVTLEKGVKVDGATIKALTMREPTVEDQLTAQEATKSAGRAEVAVIANLCEVAPNDIARLTLRDYGRVQEAYGDFT